MSIWKFYQELQSQRSLILPAFKTLRKHAKRLDLIDLQIILEFNSNIKIIRVAGKFEISGLKT